LAANQPNANAPEAARVPQAAVVDYPAVARLAWRALVRLGVAADSVADAVQDTLLVVHRRWPEFRGQSALETWIYGIVLRVASDHRKRARRRSRVIDPNAPLPDEVASTQATPFDQVADRNAAAVLLRLLDELPEDLRNVFVLVELEELTLEATARALGVLPTTCQSRLRSARRLFNTAVTREGPRLARIGGSP
jgi:RNA polymerase sigma-70 factor (ECF subfamily)